MCEKIKLTYGTFTQWNTTQQKERRSSYPSQQHAENYAKWSKPSSEGQIPYGLTFKWRYYQHFLHQSVHSKLVIFILDSDHTFFFVGKEKSSSTLLGSWVEFENWTDKNRLTGEKHTNFIEFLHVHGSLHRRMKTWRSD